MRLPSLLFTSVAALLLAAGLPARACYSGLLYIPTAETIGAGQIGVTLQMDGQIPDTAADTFILNTQFGFGERVEAGVDYDLSSGANPLWLFNAKYVQPVTEQTAVAVGATGIGNHLRPTYYAVASHDFSVVRGHVGALYSEGDTQWFLGADRAVNDKLTLMADYTSGDEFSTTVGFDYALCDNFSIMPGVIFPNDGSETRFTLFLNICGSYQRATKGD